MQANRNPPLEEVGRCVNAPCGALMASPPEVREESNLIERGLKAHDESTGAVEANHAIPFPTHLGLPSWVSLVTCLSQIWRDPSVGHAIGQLDAPCMVSG